MPKVSFILPAYKQRFLKESIDSILAQTYRDFELVIVDDKSPEGLYEVIKEYKWEPTFEALPGGGRKWLVDGIPVRYYQNAENIGGKDLVAAWNHAMEYATGEWCVLASDDDRYLPGFLSEMCRLTCKYPNCDLVRARLAIIDGNGLWSSVGEQRVEFESQIQMIYSRCVRRVAQFAPEFMFRRSALERIGSFVNFPLAWYSDDATWMSLARNGVACSQEILFEFRMSGENISSRVDNVLPKIEAGKKFRQWFDSFYRTLKPINIEDKFLMNSIHKGVALQVERLIRQELVHVHSFSSWMRIVLREIKSNRKRLICMADRYPSSRLLVRLLTNFE